MQTNLLIDDACFAIEFAGFSEPLRARALDGSNESIELAPWRCRDHLRELRASLRVGLDGELELDAVAYADAVLDDRGLWARPLALWWASGVEPLTQPQAPTAVGEWITLDRLGTRARMRGWTWGERLASEQRHVDDDGFDVVGHLESMLFGCAVEVVDGDGAPVQVADLDAGCTRVLLAAIGELNHPDTEAGDDPLASLSPALAESTLRLCGALGWTPDRVLETPARDVQRLLALLDRVDGKRRGRASRPRRTPARRPSLADHPDAVVIRFDEPGGDA